MASDQLKRIVALTTALLSLAGCASTYLDASSKKSFLHKTKTSEHPVSSCYSDRKTKQQICSTYMTSVTTTVAEVSLGRSTKNEDCYLILTGSINEELTNSTLLALKELKTMQCKRKIVVLNSPGGSVAAAMSIGKIVRDSGFFTLFDGRRGGGTSCASSCTLIFISGVERIATENPIPIFQGRMGFHQWSRELDGKRICADESMVRQRLVRYAGEMLSVEGMQNFIEMTIQTECKNVERYTPQQLLQTQIATGLKLD